MAVGDEAAAAGYPLVPATGEEGKVKWGYREINRTRDFIAQVLGLIPSSKSAYRTQVGITSSTLAPVNTDGADGDIHFKTLP
jgi:hypothetical protein